MSQKYPAGPRRSARPSLPSSCRRSVAGNEAASSSGSPLTASRYPPPARYFLAMEEGSTSSPGRTRRTCTSSRGAKSPSGSIMGAARLGVGQFCGFKSLLPSVELSRIFWQGEWARFGFRFETDIDSEIFPGNFPGGCPLVWGHRCQKSCRKFPGNFCMPLGEARRPTLHTACRARGAPPSQKGPS